MIMLRRKSPSGYNALSSPSVTQLGIGENKLKNVMSSPSLQITSEARTKLDMPLSMVVGQESIKTALILLAVNPNIGGLAITGSKGVCSLCNLLFVHFRSCVLVCHWFIIAQLNVWCALLSQCFSSISIFFSYISFFFLYIPPIHGLYTGTAKSVMARALHRVMPPIERIKGSQYNVAPDAGLGMIDDFLSQRMQRENITLAQLETEIVTCPFVQVGV